MVTPLHHLDLIATALDNNNMLDRWCLGDRFIGSRFQREDFTAPISTIGRDQHLRFRIIDAIDERLGRETSEDHRVWCTNASTSQHRNRRFGNHRKVNVDTITLGHPEVFQRI